MKRIGIVGLAGLALAAAAIWLPSLLAVESVNVEQPMTEGQPEGSQEGAMDGALFEDVAINNLGRLKLTRKLETLLKDDKDVAFVKALAADDKGNVYAATAPNGKLFRVTPAGECELWYTAKEKTLQSLAIGPKGEVYLGTGGGTGQIYRVVAKNVAEPVLDKDWLDKDGLAYVWSMVVLADGRIIAGTGPNGELIAVTPNGKPAPAEVLFKPEKDKQKNILSVTAEPSGKTVYFGTDTDGLVFKYDLAARKPFLLYNADEAEIRCLALAADGTLYAGTADVRGGAEMEHSEDAESGESSLEEDTDPGIMGDSAGEDSSKDADESKDQSKDKGKATDLTPAGKAAESASQKMLKSKAEPKSATDSAGQSGADQAAASSPARGPGAASQPERGGKAAGKTAGNVKAATTRPETGGAGKTVREMGSGGMASGRSMRGGHGLGGAAPGGEAGGNAVYRIDPQGFVTEILRQPGLVLALLLDGKKVIVAIGNKEDGDGRVLAVTPGQDEIVTLAKPKDVKQVLALARTARDGAIYIGTANAAVIGRIDAAYAAKGTFTSKPIDARSVARWGVIRQKSETAAGGSVRVQTRSGNLAEPEDSLWSAWSEPMAAAEPVAINSPVARFIQYRLILTSDKPDVTPSVESVTLSYIHDVQTPKITQARAIAPGSGGEEAGEGGESGGGGMNRGGERSGLIERSGLSGSHSGPAARVMPTPSGPGGRSRSGLIGGGEEGGGGGGVVNIVWTAADPNDDTLEFSLFFRKAGSQIWVPLTKEPIQEQNFQWPTRGLPDGQYQVKIVASNGPSNPPGAAREDTRLTDVFTVNNTPPVINNFRVVSQEAGKVTLAAEAASALTRLAGARVKIDQVSDEGKMLLPVSGIWDQKTASLRFTLDLPGKDKPPTGHVIILTVTDVAGNLASASVEIGKP